MLTKALAFLRFNQVDKLTVRKIEQCLSTYKNDLFPFGLLTVLNKLIIEKSKVFNQQGITIRFSLPFPCAAQHNAINDHLAQNLPSLDTHMSITTEILPVYQHELTGIKNIIAISSGKGGVGKSTTTVNLAYALQKQGCSVGILDGDVYGPSLPTLLGLEGQYPKSPDGKHLAPLINNGIAAMSTGFLADDQEARIWRGSVASGTFEQMLKGTLWANLDYLFIDMPPGTGDIQLTLAQKIPQACAVIVTTPQDIALLDATKGIAMFEKVNMPVLGMIENMSFYDCPNCGNKSYLFGERGGEHLASSKELPLFGKLPLNIEIRESADAGKQLIADKSTENQKIIDLYASIASKVTAELYYQKDGRSPKVQ